MGKARKTGISVGIAAAVIVAAALAATLASSPEGAREAYLDRKLEASAGPVTAMNAYGGDGMGLMPTAEPAMPQQSATELAEQQARDLRWPPGQYIYLSKSQIYDITTGLVDRLPLLDIDRDSIVSGALTPIWGGWLHEEVTPHFTDPSLAFRYITLMLNAGYDATAPYHETAVGVYSRIKNLESGSSDIRDINTASFHSAYQLLMKFDPDRKPQWDRMLEKYGLDPTDGEGLELDCFQEQPHELTSPVAIGNLAGKCVWEGRVNDGFNHSGEETGGYPFMDTTGYAPVNPANVLVDPSRWQPQILHMGNGEYVAQQFVTPQWANTRPYTDIDPRSMRAGDPTWSDHLNEEAYKAQADEVLHEVANLDDRKKIIAEYIDNKARNTIFFPAVKAFDFETQQARGTMELRQINFLLHIAMFDAGIVAWQEKARHDMARPETAIQHIYGDQLVPTYDDKNPDTPEMIPASQWKPYLDTGNHPEYPSGSTCFCAAEAQAWRSYLGSDVIPLANGSLGFSGILPAKSSIHERGITPVNPVNVTYATWTEFVNECGESRIWSGVHFRPAVESAIELCTSIGDTAYEYFQTLLDGTAPPRGGPDRALDADPLLAGPHFTGR